MTPERIALMRQKAAPNKLHWAVSIYLEECLDEIERLQADRERLLAALGRLEVTVAETEKKWDDFSHSLATHLDLTSKDTK